MAKKATTTEVEVMRIERGSITFMVKGTEPLLFNSLATKAKRELLKPSGRKTATERKTQLKHNPFAEFRSAPHTLTDGADTLLALPSTAFKGAMMTAALDIEGVTKTAIGRQVYVPGQLIPVYGIPYLHMTGVRSADMNKTPDIRTRAIVPEWCCEVTVQFAKPILREKSVVNLFAAAGIISGVGDFRPEKGKGTCGQYELVSAGDKEFAKIKKSGGRKAQIEAMRAAEPYDNETADLLEWFAEQAHADGWEIDGITGEATKADAESNGRVKVSSS